MESLLPHEGLAGVVLEKHLSVKAAAVHFGYSEQYLRRLLRIGRLEGVKIGQVWLIRLASLDEHRRKGQVARDRRCGPQWGTAGTGKGVAP
jgi:excisionase family DNA binding protein